MDAVRWWLGLASSPRQHGGCWLTGHLRQLAYVCECFTCYIITKSTGRSYTTSMISYNLREWIMLLPPQTPGPSRFLKEKPMPIGSIGSVDGILIRISCSMGDFIITSWGTVHNNLLSCQNNPYVTSTCPVHEFSPPAPTSIFPRWQQVKSKMSSLKSVLWG